MAVNTSWSGTRRSFPKPVARRILERAGRRCEINGPDCIGTATEADHHIPVAEWPIGQPGCDDESNGRAACTPCHRAKTKQEQARGNARKPKLTRPAEKHPGLR